MALESGKMNARKHRILTSVKVISASLLFTSQVLADAHPYRGVVDLESRGTGLTCRHHHSYENPKAEKLAEDPFGKRNVSSWSSCMANGKTLYNIPTPPFAHISVQMNHLVGISNIKYYNSVQYAVIDISGKVVISGHVSSEKMCFSEVEWFVLGRAIEFEPRFWSKLVERRYGLVVFDFANKHLYKTMGGLDFYYGDHLCGRDHDSGISESSNFINWYNKDEPSLSLMMNESGVQISVKKPENKGTLILP